MSEPICFEVRVQLVRPNKVGHAIVAIDEEAMGASSDAALERALGILEWNPEGLFPEATLARILNHERVTIDGIPKGAPNVRAPGVSIWRKRG